jgi:hypothetical protein
MGMQCMLMLIMMLTLMLMSVRLMSVRQWHPVKSMPTANADSSSNCANN